MGERLRSRRPSHRSPEAADILPRRGFPPAQGRGGREHGGHAQQHGDLQQPAPQVRPPELHRVLDEEVVQKRQPEEGVEQGLGGQIPGDGGGIEHGHQGIEPQAQHCVEQRVEARGLHREEHAPQPHRDGGPIDLVPSAGEQQQREEHVGRQGQEDLERQDAAGDEALPRIEHDAYHCRAKHAQRCQDDQDVDGRDPISSSLFHSAPIGPVKIYAQIYLQAPAE